MSERSERRVACVDVPALPLQLVLRTHPEWRDDPVVVTEDERPEARIVWANRPARLAHIRRGQRFREAEALVARLHAAVVPASELEAAGTELLQLLLQFSPSIEPGAEPGLFFVDANGLHELFTGLEAWGQALHRALTARGFVASVVVGFGRFTTFAVARSRSGWVVLSSVDEERQLAFAVPFASLVVSPQLRERMQDLGVRTLGEFAALPVRGLGRLGQEAKVLHARAAAPWTPIAAVSLREPVRFSRDFEMPEADLERFLAVFLEELQNAVSTVARRHEAITALLFSLRLERAPARDERLATAAPTLDTTQMLELLRLRLAKQQLAGAVEGFAVEIESVRVTERQLELLTAVRRRDPAAAARAFARLRALFGPEVVTRARLEDQHLPERRFSYEPLPAAGVAPGPRTEPPPRPARPPLVRVLLPTPAPLGTMPVHEPEAWLGEYGAVQRAHGPYRTSGGWWRERIERDYFFLETDRGAVLWVFHDRRSRRWYLHGRVD